MLSQFMTVYVTLRQVMSGWARWGQDKSD